MKVWQVTKNKKGIQEWTKQILWKTAFKNLKGYGLLKQTIHEADHIPSNFIKAVFHKIYLVHS